MNTCSQDFYYNLALLLVSQVKKAQQALLKQFFMYTAIISYNRRAIFHILKPTTPEILQAHCNGLHNERKMAIRKH